MAHCRAQLLSGFPAAAQVVVTGNQLIDPMCSGTNGATFNPALYATSVSQPFSFVNVSALNFQGNTITIDGNCAASQVPTPGSGTLRDARMWSRGKGLPRRDVPPQALSYTSQFSGSTSIWHTCQLARTRRWSMLLVGALTPMRISEL